MVKSLKVGVLCLLILSGCSTNTVTKYEEVVVPIPEHLLKHPCVVVGPGTTVEQLAVAYTRNTSCVGKYKGVIDGLANYNKQFIKQITGEVKDERIK